MFGRVATVLRTRQYQILSRSILNISFPTTSLFLNHQSQSQSLIIRRGFHDNYEELKPEHKSKFYTNKLSQLVGSGDLSQVPQLVSSPDFVFDPKEWKKQFPPKAAEGVLIALSTNKVDPIGIFTIVCILRAVSLQHTFETSTPESNVLLARAKKEMNIPNHVSAESFSKPSIIYSLKGKFEDFDQDLAPSPKLYTAIMKMLIKNRLSTEAAEVARWMKPKKEKSVDISYLSSCVEDIVSQSLSTAVKKKSDPNQADDNSKFVKPDLGEDYSREQQRESLLVLRQLAKMGKVELLTEYGKFKESGLNFAELVSKSTQAEIDIVESYLDAKEKGDVSKSSFYLTRLYFLDSEEEAAKNLNQ